MIGNPWTQVLEQFEPTYQDLKYQMEHAPNIRLVLRKVNLFWRVRIEEDWDSVSSQDQYQYYTANSGNLDTRCDWSAEQLRNWTGTTRLSYQEWKFCNRITAEKFLTIFNLKWACQ